jgi:hypothetical protein
LPQIISYQEAKTRALKRYFTGKPCKRGHVVERKVTTGCVECARLRKLKSYSKDQTARQLAQALGLKRYFTGKPCPYGHISERSTVDGSCFGCRQTKRVRQSTNPEYLDKQRARARRWRENNLARHKAKLHKWRSENGNHVRVYIQRWRANNPDLVRARFAEYRAALSNPTWANRKELSNIYAACPPGMQVDHIVPLKGRTVEGYKISGLHVPWNLQFLPAAENFRKKNQMRLEDQGLCEHSFSGVVV